MALEFKMVILIFVMSLIARLSSLDTLEYRVGLTVKEAVSKYLPSCASCKDKCGIKMSKKPLRGCSCDKLCLSYRDCCPDFTTHCPAEAVHEHPGFTPVFTPHCTKVAETILDYRPYLLVDSCEYNISACNVTSDSPEQIIPIWDAVRKIHFVNFNCAVCNGAKKLTPWPTQLTCPRSKVKVRQNISETMKKEELNTLWQKCTVTMTPDIKVMDNPRICVPDDFIPPSSCDRCLRTNFENMCHNGDISYINVLTSKGEVPFKNFFNFICSRFEPLTPDSINCIDFKPGLNPPIPGFFSFKLLFDVNLHDGFVVGENRIPDCPEGETWSLGEQQCRKTYYDDKNYNQSLSKMNIILILEDGNLTQIVSDKLEKIYLPQVQRTNAYLLKPKMVALTLYVRNQTTVNQEKIEETIGIILSEKQFRMFYLEDTKLTCTPIHVYDKTEFEFVIPNSIKIIKTKRTFSKFKIVSNFSVAVCADSVISYSFSAMSIVTIIFTSLSIIALTIRLLLHCLLADGGPARLQVSLVTSLLVAMAAFLLNPFFPFPQFYSLCYIVAVFIHWSFLAAFCWMAMIGWDILYMFKISSDLQRTGQGNRRFLFYSLYGWGFPTLTVAASLISDKAAVGSPWTPAYAGSPCLISNKVGLIIFFVAPVALQIVINIIFFVGCVIYLYKNKLPGGNTIQERNRLWIHVRLFILMGITWVVGFVAIPLDHDALWYVFIILNASQGIFLLLVYLLTKRTQQSILEKYRCNSRPAETSTSLDMSRLRTLKRN